jgi:hypothetical protein
MHRQIRRVIAFGLMMTAAGARAELVGHWTLNDSTSGILNVGTNGALSDLDARSTSDGLNIMTLPMFHATGGFDGGGYASFDGVNQGLTTYQTNNAAQNLSNYPFTIAAWIRPAGQVGNVRGTALSLTRTAGSSQYYRMGMGYAADDPHPGDFEVVRSNSTLTQLDAVGTFGMLTNGSWHHAAVVFAATDQVQMYLDGALVNTVDPATPATVTFNNLVNAVNLGLVYRATAQGGFIDWWKGDIDDPRLYDTALTAQEIRALVPVPGDFDSDGDVDGADFVAWQTNFPTATGATRAQGDADGDGDVDGADFVVWQTNFPFTPSPAASPIPEPMSLCLNVIGLGMLSGACWRGRSRKGSSGNVTN